MKQNKGKKTYILSSALLLLASACSDADLTGNTQQRFEDDGMTEVTLNVSIADAVVATRGYKAEDNHIGSGSKIDMLIYEVYESAANEDKYSLAEIYQANYGDEKKAGQGAKYDSITGAYKPSSIQPGQTYDSFKAGDTYSFTIKVDKAKKYKIACWAQSSDCGAYNTTEHLTNVTVSYKDAANNDETRDAFSGVSDEIYGSQRYQTIEIELTRPLAQINIGTSGADYANLIYGEYLNPSGVTITQSFIRVKGVANSFNVLTGEAVAVNENGVKSSEELVAEFNWAVLPAWVNSKVPERSETYNKDNKDEDPFVKQKSEEFLYVSLNGNDSYAAFTTQYPTISENGKYLTETFKYLSMCYVLVPGIKATKEKPAVGNIVTINFNLQGSLEEYEGQFLSLTERELMSVPVMPNYRTNILGGLYTKKDEPDPTSIFNFYQLPLTLVSDFITDYNARYYTASLNITRYSSDDGLEIEQDNAEDIDVKDFDKTTSISQRFGETIFFTNEKCEYYFFVKEGYEVDIINYTIAPIENKDNKDIVNWELIKPGSNNLDEEERERPTKVGKSRTTLVIYPGSTAGSFTIEIKEKDSDNSGQDSPGEPDDNGNNGDNGN